MGLGKKLNLLPEAEGALVVEKGPRKRPHSTQRRILNGLISPRTNGDITLEGNSASLRVNFSLMSPS